MGLAGQGEKRSTVYVWAVPDLEGSILRTGTLAEWAKDFENSYYSGEQEPSTRVFTWDGTGDPIEHQVQVERGELNENDYQSYTIRVNGETAFVAIDGRA